MTLHVYDVHVIFVEIFRGFKILWIDQNKGVNRVKFLIFVYNFFLIIKSMKFNSQENFQLYGTFCFLLFVFTCIFPCLRVHVISFLFSLSLLLSLSLPFLSLPFLSLPLLSLSSPQVIVYKRERSQFHDLSLVDVSVESEIQRLQARLNIGFVSDILVTMVMCDSAH